MELTYMCPVLTYLAIRGSQEGLLFRFQDNSPLTKSRFVDKFWQLLHVDQAEMDGVLYAGNSFLIGATTTAAANGVEDSTIQTLGKLCILIILQGVSSLCSLTPDPRLKSTPVCRSLLWRTGKRQAKFKFTGYINMHAHVHIRIHIWDMYNHRAGAHPGWSRDFVNQPVEKLVSSLAASLARAPERIPLE